VSWDPDSPDVPPQGAGRTPNDSTRRPHEFLMPSAPCGGLVGKIGEDGKAFFIGTSLRISAPNDGELYLATNDRAPHFEDNEGQFEVMLTIGAGARDGATAPPVAEPLEPVPAVEEAPGKVIFQGRYRHWRGGREIAEPGALWLKQQEDGTLAAIAHLPFTNSTSVAQGDKDNRLTRYETRSESSDGRPGYRIALECLEDKALATRSGLREDWDNKELAVPGGAVFDPNTRPDPYCAANILLRGFAVEEGQSKEFEVYDWDNSGNGLASYRIRIAHQGNEQVTVSAGTFEANHIVLTQLASADTWFKKREGHVTDFWVLDNGVIVRILRHREPYELQLLDWRAEEELPGLLKKPAKVVTGRLTVVSAEYGAGDKWVDVTEHVRQRIQNNTLTVRASNDLAGDPIYGVSKKLKVHYRVGDTSYVTSVDEMETLCLPEAGTVQSTGRGATPGGQLGVGGHDLATEVEKEIGEHYGKASPEVQEYIRWTATNFGRGGLWLPESAFDGIEPSEREARIQGCLEILQTDYGRHMCESLAAAGVLKDKRLLPGLARVATYQQEGGQDNRAKWMATAALGRLGDESAIPALIPLVDHYNKNTRLWAQASLARLTGEGFGDDKQAWATWWNESGKGPAIDAAALSPAVDSGPSAHHPLEPIPTAAELPGTLVFHGRYTHRSRGRDYDQPGSLWVKQQEDGAVVALSHMPFFNETALAVGDATHRPIHYAASRQAMGRYPAFEARLDFHEDKAIQIRHWGDEKDDKEYPIESGALFDLNSRPDPYAVCNILIRRFALEPGESKEFTMCDWGTSEHGEGTLPSYRVRVEHKGKGEVTVPGGAFEANHLVLTQLTSADTWFKKRADHVTDFWVLDNGVIVRILRHREPYEIELLDWATPEAPPGMLERKSTPTPLP